MNKKCCFFFSLCLLHKKETNNKKKSSVDRGPTKVSLVSTEDCLDHDRVVLGRLTAVIVGKNLWNSGIYMI